MRYHLIAIGGSAMHSLAICLKNLGHNVSGSDDEIFEPAWSRLKNHGILPDSIGWNKDRITQDIDAIILGMHAKAGNPELEEAKSKNLKIFSYPEFLYECWKLKQRIVIAGSHGKTTITSALLHLFLKNNLKFDFMVGAQLKGFDNPLKITKNNSFTIIEGDEYLSSAIDRRPKFIHYKPHFALISGIAWDHINVFPTFDIYKKQFSNFIDTLENNATLVYFEGDENLKQIVESSNRKDLTLVPYNIPSYQNKLGKINFEWNGINFETKLIGEHNLANMVGALELFKSSAKPKNIQANAFSDFEGPSKRLETVYKDENIHIIKDFAHAPSKVKATLEGVKRFNPHKQIIAFLELHTYSSLNPEFLPQYAHSLDLADKAIVYYSKQALKIKGLPDIEKEKIKQSFENEKLIIINEKQELINQFEAQKGKDNSVYLMMSSGNWEGLNLMDLKG